MNGFHKQTYSNGVYEVVKQKRDICDSTSSHTLTQKKQQGEWKDGMSHGQYKNSVVFLSH